MMTYDQYIHQNPESEFEDYENYLSYCEDREYEDEINDELGVE